MSEESSTRAKEPAATAVPLPRRGPLAHEACPFCGVVAVIEPSAALRFACGVCGKARVPIDDPALRRAFPEKEALLRASGAHGAAVAWSVASIASAGFALVSLSFLALAALAAHPGLALVVVAALAASAPLLFAAWGYRAASRHRARVAPALDEAWSQAAREAVEGRDTIHAAELAKLMRVSEGEAEQLLIMLSTDGHVRSRVVDADLEFSPSRRARALPPSTASDDAAERDGTKAASEREPR